MHGRRTLLAAATLLAAPPFARAQRATTLKFASATLNDVQHEHQRRFKDLLEARSDGRIRVEIYPASQLGPIPSMVDGVALGTIEAFITATAFLAQIDPRFQLFDVPGLFGDAERTARILADPALRRRAFDYGQARGLQPVSLFLHSPNSFLARRPIRGVDDLRGLKIRTLGTPLQVEPIRRLGAIPVPMALSEVMPALQTGAIDGLVSSPTVATAFRYYDVVRPLTIVPTWPLIVTVILNRRWLARLPDDLRITVLAVADEAERGAIGWGREDIARAAERWTAGGGEIIPASPEFLRDLQERFVAAAAPVIEASVPLRAEVAFVRAMAERA